MKRHLIFALAALTLATGAFAQTTNQAVRKRVQNLTTEQKEALRKAATENRKTTTTTTTIENGTAARPATSTTTTNQATGTASRPSTSNTNHTAELKNYLESSEYRSKETAKALITATSESLKDLPKIIVNSEGAFVLNNKKRDNTDQSGDAAFFGADESVVYPGSLVYVNQKLADGDPVPCSFSPGKVRLTIDKNVPGGNSYADVINDYSHVHQQIVNWVTKIGSTDASYTASGSTSYYSDASHMAADMKVSASFLKSSAKVDMSTETNELKIIAVENFCQNFYTVYASAINNDPTSLIGSGTSASTIKSRVNTNGPIGIISSVTYGRRAYRFREFHSKDFTFKGDESLDVKVGGSSGSVASTQNVTNSQKTSKFWAFVQSGNHTDKEIFNNNDANNGNSDFMQAVNKSSHYSAYNIGVPRNFTVRFIGNNNPAKRVVTDVYYETEYQPCPKTVTFELHKHANQVAGSTICYWANYKVIHVTKSRDRNGNTKYDYELWTSPRTKDAGDADKGYVDYFKHKFSQGEGNKTRMIPTDDCPDNENCYIYGEIKWRLTGNRSSGKGWSDWEEGKLPVSAIPADPSGSGKRAIIHIAGSNYAGKSPYIRSDSTGKSNK